MSNREIKAFIDEMNKIGDYWTEEQVENTYGDCSLREALADRKALLDLFFCNIANIINN